MPTKNKRINIAIPDNIYEKLLVYKEKNGVTSDAGACLQLITRQLNAIEQTENLLKLASKFTEDELQTISVEGGRLLKQLSDERIYNKTDE